MTHKALTHGRLPWPEPADLSESARAVHEAITGGPRATGPRLFQMATAEGRLEGPFNAMLSAPDVGLALQELGARIRYGSHLTDRCREIAILLVAQHHRSDYEWYAHEAVGRAVGLTDSELRSLRSGDAADSFDSQEVAVVDLVRGLLVQRAVGDAVMADALTELGIERVTETAVLVGYYQTLDLLIRTWEAPLPAGVDSEFDDVERGGSDD